MVLLCFVLTCECTSGFRWDVTHPLPLQATAADKINVKEKRKRL